MLCPADKKRVSAGAMELEKVLNPENCLLHVVAGRQEAGENRCSGTGKGAYPQESPSPCSASRQEASENWCSGTEKNAYPREPPPLCCAQQARSG